MSYIDGFVIPVPSANRESFVQHARHVDQLFLDYGAVRVVEAWGDDVPDGKLTDFNRAVRATKDETVVFSWVEWPDKATREAAMDKVRNDPRMVPHENPFDGKRLIFGGFTPVLDLKK